MVPLKLGGSCTKKGGKKEIYAGAMGVAASPTITDELLNTKEERTEDMIHIFLFLDSYFI